MFYWNDALCGNMGDNDYFFEDYTWTKLILAMNSDFSAEDFVSILSKGRIEGV